MLDSLDLDQVYDSSEYHLIHDLQVPLLRNSVDYLRGVGYFTSGWLRVASDGLADFIKNGGKARIVLSPILQESDWDALKLGEQAKFDHELKDLLAIRIQDLKTSFEKDEINALAWMIAEEILEIRFAIPRMRSDLGIYHDKVGIFKDSSGNVVVIHGSLNDSYQGSLNGEAFSVFKSWESGQLSYLKKHVSRLENLWNDKNTQFRVCLMPEAIRDEIISLRTTAKRPYSRACTNIEFQHPKPSCPVNLYPFQERAIEKWISSGCQGIWEMATGTGKTITALAAAVRRINEIDKLAIVILVPYLHLLEQWERVCKQFGFTPILCSGNHGKWQIEVKSQVQDFNLGANPSLCILAVQMTSALPRFQDAISGLKPDQTMLIGDEAHRLGSKQLRKALIPNAGMRLGLSATPRRWFDDKGTEILRDYFGGTCFEYTLEEAIGKFLTRYNYYPQLVNLTSDELLEYEELSSRIGVLAQANRKDFEKMESLKKLLLQRALIISSASEKLPLLLKILQQLIDKNRARGEDTQNILVYCAPGEHKDVLKAIAGLGLRCHEFVHYVSLSDREKLLKQFASGEIEVLVAIKCLDEGVDVPSTKTAFILASTTNPREFVQRRGRVLRLSPGKTEAEIYDFIVVPSEERFALKTNSDRSILSREMPRFAEFAAMAKNEFHARSLIRDILDQFEMLNLLDEKPWDIYHTLKQWDWSENE